MDPPATSRIFQAAEAKLERAYDNLHALSTERDSFVKSCPDPLTVEFDRGSGWWIAKMRVEDEPPPRFGVLVGDIAYQCLSAFNHLVWELATRKVGRRKVWGVKDHVQLPITLKPKAFQDNPLVTHPTGRGRGLVSKKALAVIEGLQPYKEGHGPSGPLEHPLPLIKEIADSDKHRVLAGTFAQSELQAVNFRWDSRVASNPTHEILVAPGMDIVNDAPIVRIRFETGNAEANVQVNRQPELDVIFNTDSWRVPFDKVENALNWAYDRLYAFAPFFPVR